MRKIAFVYATLGKQLRSGNTGSRRMANLHPLWMSVDDACADYVGLRNSGYTVFLYNHKPSLFVHRKLCPQCLEDIVNTRSTWLDTTLGKTCISGLSYWKRRRGYKCFFPTLSTYRRKDKPSRPCLGYYSRSIRPDSNFIFTELATRVPLEVDVYVMGDKLPIKRPYVFTYDEDEFFSHVTHYFYYRSNYHDDPWPHTLVQAAQVGCTLVVPNSDRDWKDGVDDILTVCPHIVDLSAPWEHELPCTNVPTGEDFLRLYEGIAEDFNWLPNPQWSFADLCDYALSL